MPVFLNATDPDFEADFTILLGAKREDSVDVDDIVAGIIADVRARGDAAVIEAKPACLRSSASDAVTAWSSSMMRIMNVGARRRYS